MPRRLRPDLHPVIEMPDSDEANAAARRVVGPAFGAGAWVPDSQQDRWYVVKDELGRRLADLRELKVKINYELLMYLMNNVTHARFENVTDEDGNVVMNGQLKTVRLRHVGCRVHKTQHEIADDLKMDVATVNKHVAVLRDWCFITNWGHGWIELSADLVWRGKQDLGRAYANHQVLHPSLRMTIVGVDREQWDGC